MNDGEFDASEPLELLRLVHHGHVSMHRLHAQHLVIALLVVKHGRGEIFKHVVAGKRSIGLYPFVPDEEPMAVVVRGMEVVDVHGCPN